MQAVQQVGQGRVLGHSGVPLSAGGAQTAAGGAGVVDGVALLCRVLGVYPQTDALACRLGGRAELCQLVGRVEDDVVGIAQQLLELIGPECGAENVVLLVRQSFFAQAALVQAAGFGACQIGGQHGVAVKIGKSLLRQQNFAAGALLHAQQDLAVAAQLRLVQKIAGGGQGRKRCLREICQPGKGRAAVGEPHQSTRAGAWLSERGRPYWSRAAR